MHYEAKNWHVLSHEREFLTYNIFQMSFSSSLILLKRYSYPLCKNINQLTDIETIQIFWLTLRKIP